MHRIFLTIEINVTLIVTDLDFDFKKGVVEYTQTRFHPCINSYIDTQRCTHTHTHTRTHTHTHAHTHTHTHVEMLVRVYHLSTHRESEIPCYFTYQFLKILYPQLLVQKCTGKKTCVDYSSESSPVARKMSNGKMWTISNPFNVKRL